MKKLLLALLCIMTFTITSAQSNKDIANVYIKRSQESLDNIEVELALDHYNKAMKYMDTITTSKVAELGMRIHYELSNYSVAKRLATQYFVLEKNKKSEIYAELLDLYVNIEEELEAEIAEQKRLEEERIKKENELRKIDSLKTVWNDKSNALSIKVDSIFTFTKQNVALYTKDNNYGIINDKGVVMVKAEEYKAASSFDGFILLMNKAQESTKIYCYNTKSNIGFLLPSVSDFNSLSTHYGKVMLPRGNGRLVMYPNNSYEPMVYDLNVKKTVKISNEQDLFKNLKKNDIIDKYNKDGEVKVNKEWYEFGGHLGGGIHPLYSENNYQVHSFLCSIDGSILGTTSDYQYIGAFHNNKFQAIKGGETLWINQNGTKVSAAKDESGAYIGNSKVVKLDAGAYQIFKDGVIILGDEKLITLGDFLREFAPK